MNGNGLALALFGAWALVQIFAGDALERLKLIKSSPPQTFSDTGPMPAPPFPGGPVPKPNPGQVPPRLPLPAQPRPTPQPGPAPVPPAE